MSAPTKPWERNSVLVDQAQSSSSLIANGGLQLGSVMANPNVPPCCQGSNGIQGANRPPLPPRPQATSSVGYGMDSSMYGSVMPGMYGSSMYGSPMYGGAGYGAYSSYGRSGYGLQNMNSFACQAESSARGAFQSVESLVSAVSSISMMLESTYCAMQNSFRAVLGVADQFSRLKMQLSQIAASFAIFRFIKWLYRRLLVLLKLRAAGLPDDAWNKAVNQSAQEAKDKFPIHQKASWPIVLFLAITLGGPYLIWKMLSNIATTNPDDQSWMNGSLDSVVGECKYNFVGERDDELSFSAGQRITLAPAELQPRLRENDWLLASIDGKKSGIVPANYIRILGRKRGEANQTKLTDSSTQPTVQTETAPTGCCSSKSVKNEDSQETVDQL